MSKKIRVCDSEQDATYSEFDEDQVVKLGEKKRSYQIKCKLGSGVQGSVYKAKDVEDGRDVAIKTNEDIESEESGCLRKVTSEFPNDPRYLQYIDQDDSKLVTDYDRDYVTIERFMEMNKLTNKQAMKIIENVEDAIDDLSKKKINHGDLSIRNVLIHPKTLEIKLIDFGLCQYGGSFATIERSPWLSDDRALYTKFYKDVLDKVPKGGARSKSKKSCFVDDGGELQIREECKKLNKEEMDVLNEISKVDSKGLFFPKITVDDAVRLLKETSGLKFVIVESEDDHYLFIYKDLYSNILYKELSPRGIVHILKILDSLIMTLYNTPV